MGGEKRGGVNSKDMQFPTGSAGLEGDTPVQRHFSLLELIATRDAPSTLQGLTDETGLPKATLHRMLLQLEVSGMIRRDADGRTFYTGGRLRRLAERTLLTDALRGARHRVLADLVDKVGESCAIAALSGDEVVYLDRVEPATPLRVSFDPNARLPAYACASGRLLLSQLRPERRQKILGAADLVPFTAHSLTEVSEVEQVIGHSDTVGFAVDDEEFQTGVVCVAVPVPATSVSTMCLTVQAPASRLTPSSAETLLPVLHRAAAAIARVETS